MKAIRQKGPKCCPKPKFYRDWQFYTAACGLILTLSLSLYLYSLNKRTARIQEASFRPILFVKLKGIDVFAANIDSVPDSLKVNYDIINRGGNMALDLQVEFPRISSSKRLEICLPPDDFSPPFTSLQVGDTLHKSSRADMVGNPPADTSKPIYTHFCLRYRDLVGNAYRSYFVAGLMPQNIGDSLGYQMFDELQQVN